jgi:hypothetical protein
MAFSLKGPTIADVAANVLRMLLYGRGIINGEPHLGCAHSRTVLRDPIWTQVSTYI